MGAQTTVQAMPDRAPPARPSADTTPLLWQANTKLELAARLVSEAESDMRGKVEPAKIAEIRAHGQALETLAAEILEGAVSALERA